MICRNCRAAVDNDLVFCTSCGARLYETMSDLPTIAMSDGIVTQPLAPPVRKPSPLKWIALIVALVALPASLGIAYLLTKNQTATTANSNKSAPANRKTENKPANKTVNAAAPNANANVQSNSDSENSNAGNTNQNTNADDAKSTTIFDDRIEIASGEQIAYPFTLDGDAKITGKIQTLRGEPVKGYVFTRDAYETYFPDTNYKIFSFDGRIAGIEQLLVKGDYVLIFFNESAPSVLIKGKVEVQPNE